MALRLTSLYDSRLESRTNNVRTEQDPNLAVMSSAEGMFHNQTSKGSR